MIKQYSYVDETGQDTKGKIFVVAVPTFGDNRDELRTICEQIERSSGKNKLKWGKARPERRLEYLRLILADKRFKGCLRYAIFHNTSYDADMVAAIGRAVAWNAPADYAAMIYVDALSKNKRDQYARELHRMGIRVMQLRGVAKDENEALIRLADALAGFIRDLLTGEPDTRGEARRLYEQGKQGEVFIEV